MAGTRSRRAFIKNAGVALGLAATAREGASATDSQIGTRRRGRQKEGKRQDEREQ